MILIKELLRKFNYINDAKKFKYDLLRTGGGILDYSIFNNFNTYNNN